MKMYPEPSSLLPVTPWVIISDPLSKAAQNFSYCTFSSLFLLPFYFLIIVFRVRIFIQNFLKYITFDVIENYILVIFPYLFYAIANSSPLHEERLASPKHLFFGTPRLFFRLLTTDKFHPILRPVNPRYGR